MLWWLKTGLTNIVLLHQILNKMCLFFFFFACKLNVQHGEFRTNGMLIISGIEIQHQEIRCCGSHPAC